MKLDCVLVIYRPLSGPAMKAEVMKSSSYYRNEVPVGFEYLIGKKDLTLTLDEIPLVQMGAELALKEATKCFGS